MVLPGAGLTEAPMVESWRISLRNNQIQNLSQSRACPQVQTLLLDFNNLLSISDHFFEQIPSLRVLDLSYNLFLTSVPSGVSKLVSLRHLNLSCTRIAELPIGLNALVNLRYLNLERIYSLRAIPRRLISSFSILQVLRMLNCGEFGGTLDKNFVFDDDFLIEELFGLKQLNELSITLRTPHALERFLSSLKLKSCTQSLRLRFHSEMKSLDISSLADMKHLHKFSVSCDSLEEFEIGFLGNVQRIREAHFPCPSESLYTELQCIEGHDMASFCSKSQDSGHIELQRDGRNNQCWEIG